MSGCVEEGSSSPLGAAPSPNGVNFSVFSRSATGVQLLLFDRVDDARAARVLRLDPSAIDMGGTLDQQPLFAEPIAEPDSNDAAGGAQDQRREREEVPAP